MQTPQRCAYRSQSLIAAADRAVIGHHRRCQICRRGRFRAGVFRGEGKTDAKDARVIAETARMRSDLTEVIRVSHSNGADLVPSR
jgi:hypothetical protein